MKGTKFRSRFHNLREGIGKHTDQVKERVASVRRSVIARTRNQLDNDVVNALTAAEVPYPVPGIQRAELFWTLNPESGSYVATVSNVYPYSPNGATASLGNVRNLYTQRNSPCHVFIIRRVLTLQSKNSAAAYGASTTANDIVTRDTWIKQKLMWTFGNNNDTRYGGMAPAWPIYQADMSGWTGYSQVGTNQSFADYLAMPRRPRELEDTEWYTLPMPILIGKAANEEVISLVHAGVRTEALVWEGSNACAWYLLADCDMLTFTDPTAKDRFCDAWNRLGDLPTAGQVSVVQDQYSSVVGAWKAFLAYVDGNERVRMVAPKRTVDGKVMPYQLVYQFDPSTLSPPAADTTAYWGTPTRLNQPYGGFIGGSANCIFIALRYSVHIDNSPNTVSGTGRGNLNQTGLGFAHRDFSSGELIQPGTRKLCSDCRGNVTNPLPSYTFNAPDGPLNQTNFTAYEELDRPYRSEMIDLDMPWLFGDTENSMYIMAATSSNTAPAYTNLYLRFEGVLLEFPNPTQANLMIRMIREKGMANMLKMNVDEYLTDLIEG